MSSAFAADVKLTFLTFEIPNLSAQFWDDAIAATNKVVAGVEIEKLVSPTIDRDAYARQLDSTGQLPDIMVAVSPSGLAEAGKLAQFDEAALANWFSPRSNSYDGAIFQLPTNTQTIPLVYYRLSDFEKAGIAAVPKTWTEFLDACEALKTAGITPINVGGGGADTWAANYTLFALIATDVYAKDSAWLGKLMNGETDFNDPLFQSAVTKLKTLVDNGCIDPALLSNDYAGLQASFLGGTGGMYPMGSWFAAAPGADEQKLYGVFPMPTDDGSLVVPAYTGGGLSVSASAPDVAKAQEWAIAFSQVKENLDAFVRADALFISLKGYEPPADVSFLYNATLTHYKAAADANAVINVFGSEGGTPSLPAGFTGEVGAAVIDLISGRRDQASFTSYLNDKLAELRS